MYRLELICKHTPHECRCKHTKAVEVNADDLTANLISNCFAIKSTTLHYSSISAKGRKIKLIRCRSNRKSYTYRKAIRMSPKSFIKVSSKRKD
jgi:hypothetical protein